MKILYLKTFCDVLLDRLVGEDAGRIIFAHPVDQFSAHIEGRPHLEPIVFPEEDVLKAGAQSKELIPYAPSR